MERATVLADLVARAAKGDATAAQSLLAGLASSDPAEQLGVLRVLNQADAVPFWEHILEYLAVGAWAGVDLRAAPEGAKRWRALQPKIKALFLASAPASPAAVAREEALLRSMRSDRPELSRTAIDLAGACGNPQAVEPLLAVLNTAPERVKLEAIRALGNLGSPKAIPALIALLRDEDELAAALAKDALVAVGAPAVEPLTQALNDPAASATVRWRAAYALARMHDARAIASLVAHLSDPDYGVRWLAGEGLIALHGRGLRAVLEALATNEITPWLADSAAHVLQHAQPHAMKEAVQPVIEAVRSVDFEWRAGPAAEQALDQLAAKGLI